MGRIRILAPLEVVALAALLAALLACGVNLTCVSGQDEAAAPAAQPKIVLADPNKELTQLELFKVDELFAIAAEREGYEYQNGYEDKRAFLYGAWGRTTGNALAHLGAQFPYVCLIPRYREYFDNLKQRGIYVAREDRWLTHFALLAIDSKEAMQAVVERVSPSDEKDMFGEWYGARLVLEKAKDWNEKYCSFDPGGLRPSVWWDGVKDSWPGHPLYRAMEEALQVFLDKSCSEKERKRAGDFVWRAVAVLPLAGVLPYVEPVARDTTAPSWLREASLRIMNRLRVNDTIPVFIDLLTDLSEVEPIGSGGATTVADRAYWALQRKTGVSDLYRLAMADDGSGSRNLPYVDKIELPLKVREIVALDLCPCGRSLGKDTWPGVLDWKPISTLSEAERLRLQQNWRYFWEKMKGWILVR